MKWDGELVSLSLISPSCHAWKCSWHCLTLLVAGGDGRAEQAGRDEEPALVPPWQWSLQRCQHPWVLVLQAASQGKLGLLGLFLSPQCCWDPRDLIPWDWVVEVHLCSWVRRMHRALLMWSGGLLSPDTSFAAKGWER